MTLGASVQSTLKKCEAEMTNAAILRMQSVIAAVRGNKTYPAKRLKSVVAFTTYTG